MATRGLTFARGQGTYPRTRIVVCLLVLAAAWAVLRPVSAAVATLVVVLSFSLKTSCAVDVLAWFLIAGGAAAGAVSWPVAAVLALFPLLIVPVVLVAGDIVHKIVLPESADPLGRLAMVRIVRTWARVGVPWAALLSIVFLGGWRDAVLLLIPVALLSAGRFVIAGIWCVALWFIHGSDLATLAVAVLAAAGALAPVLARRPSRHLPLPAPQLRDGPRLALRLRRVDLALRRGDGYRAQRILDTVPALATGAARPAVLVRAALCALDDGRYQDASDAAGPAEAAPAYDRVLTWLRSEVLAAMNRSAEAVGLLRALLADPSLLSRNERVCYGLTLAQALGRTGRYAAAAKAAQAALAGTRFRGWTLERAQAYRFTAEAELARGNSAEALAQIRRSQYTLLSNWWMQYLWKEGGNQARLGRLAAGPRGRVFTEAMRTEITFRTIRAAMPGPARGDPYTLADMEGIYDILAAQGQREILADLLVAQARFLSRRDDGQQAAQDHLLRALRELDRNRYTLRSPRDRAAWSARLHDALARAVSLTVQSGDARLQAELMEFGRVQTLPYLSAAGPSGDQVALAVPPVIRVRGTAQISRYWDASRPAPVDLEAAAAAVAGTGAWWLSYWQAGSWLYWSLVPPAGPVEAGQIDFSSSSDLHVTLQAVREDLPEQLDGESPADVDVRMAQSALLTDPVAERRRSARLARLLLPATLLRQLQTRLRPGDPQPPLPLAIVPSATLAIVPWSLLVLDDPGRLCETPMRLAHGADWVLAPAASLATTLPHRPKTADRYPLRLAVVDTWQGAGLDALTAAQQQAKTLPPHVEVLGGSHWTTHVATTAALREALARTPPAATVLFACHALPASQDLTTPGGLVLAEADPAGAPRLFTAGQVLRLAADGITMPAQALLLACDSSNLSSSAAGEWLTTAPAMLAAGSTTVVTTLYPVLDTTQDNDPILAAAISGQDLRTAVRTLQRTAAAAWDSTGNASLHNTAIMWAAYAVVAANRGGPPIPEAAPGISPRLRRLLHDTAREVLSLHGRTVTTGSLLARYLAGPAAGFFSLGLHRILRDAALTLAARFLRAPRSPDATGELMPSQELLDAFTSARTFAAREGRDIEPEDILRAALDTNSAARTLARAMALVRLQRPGQLLNLLEHTLAQALLDQAPPKPRRENPKAAAFVDQLLRLTA
jgi:tetratricopeptide (TPR) repeat protein